MDRRRDERAWNDSRSDKKRIRDGEDEDYAKDVKDARAGKFRSAFTSDETSEHEDDHRQMQAIPALKKGNAMTI